MLTLRLCYDRKVIESVRILYSGHIRLIDALFSSIFTNYLPQYEGPYTEKVETVISCIATWFGVFFSFFDY